MNSGQLVRLIAPVLLLAWGGACNKERDTLHQGIFVLDNQSGLDVTLTVYNTAKRGQAPLALAVPKGQPVERSATGDFGGFSYPELFFQGDSVVFFSDGKRLLHYCPQAQQVKNTCAPSHNVLDLAQYRAEPLTKDKSRYTFTLTRADYRTAR